MQCPKCAAAIDDQEIIEDLVNRRVISLPMETGPEIGLVQWCESMQYELIDLDERNLEILVEAPWTRKPFWIPLPKRVKIHPFTHKKPKEFR